MKTAESAADNKGLFGMILRRYLFAIVGLAGLLAACAPSDDMEPLWQFETKKTHGQWAVLDSQHLFLCADDVYCLDVATGRLLWEFETFGTHSSAPVIAGERLFFQCGGLYALDAATGAVLWEFWTKTWATLAPVADIGRVYAPVGNQLFCFDAGNGKQLWSVKTGLVEKAPVLIGNRLFLSIGETILCLEASSGKRLWRFDVGSARVRLAPGGDYLLSAGFAGLVRAHQIETGEVQWQIDTPSPLVDFRVLDTGQLLISAGVLYCLDLESGVLLWILKQDKPLMLVEAHVFGQRVFARSIANEIFCVSLRDGTLIRRLRLPKGGRLLTDAHGYSFFRGSQSRELSCLSVPSL